MNHDHSGESVGSRNRLKSATSEIAQEVGLCFFESAEQNAERIAGHDFPISSADTEELRHLMAWEVYSWSYTEIDKVLIEYGLTHYDRVVQDLCIDELSGEFEDLITQFSGTGKPGPVEMAIEESAKPFKAVLADSLLGAIILSEKEAAIAAAQRRQADERRRRRAAKNQSRSWLSALKDFFSW
jgi:hypothetical protein